MSQKKFPTSQAEGHSFNVQYAATYGVSEAVLIAHFQKWINHNIVMKKNFHDGRTWMYQTRAEISAWFPYFTEKQVRTLIDKLVKYGVIIKGNYNTSNFDKTVWYAFKDEEIFTTAQTVQSSAIQKGQSSDRLGQSTAKKGHTIPCTKPCTELSSKEDNMSDASHRLARYLFSSILKINPNHKKPNLEQWAKEVDKMLLIDKRSETAVEELIDWIYENAFWCKNILSAAKLRAKFDQLVMNMNAEKIPQKNFTRKDHRSDIKHLRDKPKGNWSPPKPGDEK